MEVDGTVVDETDVEVGRAPRTGAWDWLLEHAEATKPPTSETAIIRR
jgi:hypothetical protein